MRCWRARLPGGGLWLAFRPSPLNDRGGAAPAAYASGAVGVDTSTPVAVVITQRPTRSLRPDSGANLAAEARDAAGNVMPGAPIVWSSSDSTIAKVDRATGRVHAIRPGRILVAAASGAGHDSVVISVRRPGVRVPVVGSIVIATPPALGGGGIATEPTRVRAPRPPHRDHDAVAPGAARRRHQDAAGPDRVDSAGGAVHHRDRGVARRPDDRRAGHEVAGRVARFRHEAGAAVGPERPRRPLGDDDRDRRRGVHPDRAARVGRRGRAAAIVQRRGAERQPEAAAASTAAPASSARRRARRERRRGATRGRAGPGGAGVSTTPMRRMARTPSQVAVSTAEPGRTAVTAPASVTATMVGSLELHSIGRPGSGALARSSGVARTARVCPTISELGGSAMSTAATRGGSTGMTMLARASSTAAVRRTVPGARPAIVPLGVTSAMRASAELQVTGRYTGQPCLSRGVASSRISSPACSGSSSGSITMSSALGAVTSTRSRALTFLQVAVTTAVPGASAVASAVRLSSRNTVGSSVVHSTARGGSRVPCWPAEDGDEREAVAHLEARPARA